MAKGFNGFPGGNMQAMLQQAQKMQKQLEKAQEELDSYEADGAAGGGAVKVKVSGKYEVVSVEIKPEVVDPTDVDMLQDLIRAATNEAMAKVKDNSQSKMSKATGGFNIPGLF